MISSPSFNPLVTSMFVVPLMPVTTVTKTASFLFLRTNTPCNSSLASCPAAVVAGAGAGFPLLSVARSARCRGDAGRCGQSGQKVDRRILEGHNHLEVLGFLTAGGGLRGGNSGGTQHGVSSDLGDRAFELLLGNGVDGHLSRLSQLHIYEVGLVNFHLGGNHRHVGNRHQRAAW